MPSTSLKLRESWGGNPLFLLKKGSAEPWNGTSPIGSGGKRLRQGNIWTIITGCIKIGKTVIVIFTK
jgi:type IV secretory pathway VirB4 component